MSACAKKRFECAETATWSMCVLGRCACARAAPRAVSKRGATAACTDIGTNPCDMRDESSGADAAGVMCVLCCLGNPPLFPKFSQITSLRCSQRAGDTHPVTHIVLVAKRGDLQT